MSNTKQKFVAKWGVVQMKPRGDVETLYWKDSLPFESSKRYGGESESHTAVESR